MRSVLIASAGLALIGGGTAEAQQRPGTSYGMPGATMQAPMMDPRRPGPIVANRPVVSTSTQALPHRQPRWGSKIGGRWWGGANAPGGWAAYRRPHRGWAVPGYWNAPRFQVGDWATYDLPQPPQGYNWVRYYDDAVLIDPRGSVYDTVNDVDWDRSDSGGYPAISPRDYAANDTVYAGPGERGYDDRPVPRRDTGLGGAAIGAVAGGVAGNVIAGRNNRLGGTLIGAGVGAAAGYAIDKTEDRGRRAPPPPRPEYTRPEYARPEYARPEYAHSAYRGSEYGASYAPPSAYAADYPPPPPPYRGDDRQPRSYTVAPGGNWVSPDGLTTVTTTSGGTYPAGSTTVVVQSAPVTTTTTTTEYYETVASPRRKLLRRR
ncbi:RcnB family protein [Sphingomonas faeni]|uniref:RcnB family protein n=1 Tax=Sphingomonas faeni TaxID=185950 RepID=UPI0033615072